MPMEKQAEKKGQVVHGKFAGDWWAKQAYCRIYDDDRQTVRYRTSGTYLRSECEPRYEGAGWRELEKAFTEVAREHGGGRYWFGFGRPELGEPRTAQDKEAGFWLAQRAISGVLRGATGEMTPPARKH